MTTLVQDTIEKTEKDLFLAEVAKLPDGKTKKQRKPKGEKPAVSNYAAKHSKTEVVAVAVAAMPETVKDESALSPFEVKDLLEPVLASMENDIFGALFDDYQTVLNLRLEAYDLNAKSSEIKVNELRKAMENETRRLRAEQWTEAERIYYNSIKERFGKQISAAEHEWQRKALRDAMEAAYDQFLAIQDAFKFGSNKERAEHYENLIKAVINAIPRMKERHEANLAKAFDLEFEFEQKKEEQETLYAESVKKFDEANTIARRNGWSTTEKKSKEHKGGSNS